MVILPSLTIILNKGYTVLPTLVVDTIDGHGYSTFTKIFEIKMTQFCLYKLRIQ